MIIHKFTEERPEKASLFAWCMRFWGKQLTCVALTKTGINGFWDFRWLWWELLMLEASNFSVCNASEYTYYNMSHPIYWDFVDSIPTYYGQGYLLSIILWTKTVLTIIRVIHSPKFGYPVLYLLLFRPSNLPDFERLPVRRTIQKVSFNIR